MVHTGKCVFVWKSIHFDLLRPSVHNNTPCIYIESSWIWKSSWKSTKNKAHTYRISVGGRKRIEMNKMTKNSAVACFCRMRIELNQYVTTCKSILFRRLSVDSRKRIKTIVWTRNDRWVFDKDEWAGPECCKLSKGNNLYGTDDI